ncbi:MAG: helix-turn-helix domain-containing protein [Pseudomonadota bacterium]
MKHVTIYVSPGFNLTATLHFIDTFEALNGLDTEPRYQITLASDVGGAVASHQGPSFETEEVDLIRGASDIVIVSTADAPMAAAGAPLAKHLRYWSKQDHLIVGLESGAFALADAGLLSAPACVHPAQGKAFLAAFPRIGLSDALFDTVATTRTCIGGAAALDMALTLLAEAHSADLVRAVRDFLLAPTPRDGGQHLTGGSEAPLNSGLPDALKSMIERMRGALDQSLSVPSLAQQAGLSQRQLERLFRAHTGRTPNQYYRMLRLDRAREMVTRGAAPMPEIAMACGFQSPVHFSRAYKEQFGLPPIRDRVRSRVG